jgi:excisionase family DNA binding protein
MTGDIALVQDADGVVEHVPRLAVTITEAAFLLQVSPPHITANLDLLATHGITSRQIGTNVLTGARRPTVLLAAGPLARWIDGPSAPCPAADVPLVWTPPQAARQLAVTVRTLRGAIDRGQIPGVIRLGRTVRISRRQLATAWEALTTEQKVA